MDSHRKSTYASLQAGRGIAAIMVVLFHVATIFGTDPHTWHIAWLPLRLAGFALGVEYFFVLSGAVILMAHQDDIGRPAALPSYLWKRFRRVYPIYWIVLTVVVLVYRVRPWDGAPWQANHWVILSGYALVFVRTLHVNLQVAWTLFHEVLFYALFAILFFNRKLGTALLVLWFTLSLLPIFHARYLAFYLFYPVNALFGFGMFAVWLLRSRPIPHPRLFVTVGLCLFIGSVFWAASPGNLTEPIVVTAGAGAMLLLIGTVRLEQHGSLTVPASLKFLGDASYSIYLIHYPFFMLVSPPLYRFWLHYQVPLAILFIILAVSAVAAGCALHLLVEKPLLRLLPTKKMGPQARPRFEEKL